MLATAGMVSADDPQPVDFTHNGLDEAPVSGAVFGTGPREKTGHAICTTTTSDGANVNTDCAPAAGPHNETSIAVNPTDANNIIRGSNSAYRGTGDPAIAFDADGHAYYATLGFRFVGPANATNPTSWARTPATRATDATHLAVVWSDMRNMTDRPFDPSASSIGVTTTPM